MTGEGYRQLIVFGDSLSDEGTFGFRFTTLPGHTWAHHVARHLGCSAEPAVVCNYADAFLGRNALSRPGAGLNFAQGGARVSLPYSAVSQRSWGIPWSVARQFDAFIASHHRFKPNDVVVVFAGTNDVTYRFDPSIDPAVAARLRDDVRVSSRTMNAEKRRINRAAADLAALVAHIRDVGAPLVLVLGLFDIAAAPWFRTAAAREYVGELAAAFNAHLQSRIASSRAEGLRYVDTAAALAPIIRDPEMHGFARTSGWDACADTGADCVDFCRPDEQVTPTAHRDHLFAAGLHLTTAGHEVLARHIIDNFLQGDERNDGVAAVALKGKSK